MFEEISVFDEGQESEPTVKEETVEVEAPSDLSSKSDLAEETKEETSTSEKPVDESPEGETVSEKGETEEEKSFDEVVADVDKEIADEKHPKWYKSNLEAVKKAFLKETSRISEQIEPLKDYGEVEKIVENLELVRGLESFDNKDGTPTPSVKPFVDKLVEKRGEDTVMLLTQELMERPSPFTSGWKMYHELIKGFGLDPTRIEDYKRFQASGFQLSQSNPPPLAEELEGIPEAYREAFISLTPDERDELLLMSEDLQARTLKGVQAELDAERTQKQQEEEKTQAEIQEKFQQEQQLAQDIGTRTGELLDASGAKLFDSFTESLVNAEVDKFDAIAIANALSMALNSEGVEGRATREALEAIGVKIDPSLDAAFQEWMQMAGNAATFEKRGDKTSYGTAFSRFNDLESTLIRKAKPIVAAIIKHKAQVSSNRIESVNSAIDATQSANTGLRANEGKEREIKNTSYTSVPLEDVPVF